jgi:Mn-dependent DtxR family transcriptional regulator
MTTKHYTLRDMIFRTLLKDPTVGPSKMAKNLRANYNSVKAVYAKLYQEGLLNRERRGNYSLNVAGILLYIFDQMRTLEEEVNGSIQNV